MIRRQGETQFSVLLSVLALICSACASGGSGVLRASDLDIEPEELSCPYTNVRGAYGAEGVTLGFTVLPDGTVDPGSIRRIQEHNDSSDPDLFQRAKDIVIRCEFSPGSKGGVSVPSRLRKRFYFSGGGE